jgi:hypothetical protein
MTSIFIGTDWCEPAEHRTKIKPDTSGLDPGIQEKKKTGFAGQARE